MLLPFFLKFVGLMKPSTISDGLGDELDVAAFYMMMVTLGCLIFFFALFGISLN